MKIAMKPNEQHLRRMRQIPADLKAAIRFSNPSLLVALGQTHRKQEAAIFASEGAAGGRGAWDPLNARYAARKAKAVGKKKILYLTGNMRDQFTKRNAPGYVQTYTLTSETLGTFSFGAASQIGAAHFLGNPGPAPSPIGVAAKIFGGLAPRLPVRDMVTKSAAQLAEMRETLLAWFRARMRQYIQGAAAMGGR